MSCSPFDLRDYFLKELPGPEGKQVELHVKSCAACREELERLRLAEAALVSLRDEEMPQRLAFVSDKIFEPSPVRRAWTAFWGSGARLGFASAAMLSAALVIYSFSGAAPKGGGRAEALSPQVQAAVDRAVALSQAKLEQRIAAVQEENRKERRQLVAAADALVDYSRRHEMMILRSNYGGRQ
jgi:anti-sigma factor RsiW